MNTFVKIFSDSGYGGEQRLEREINDIAEMGNLDIVSATPCFRKGFLDADTMFVVVIFRRRYVEEDFCETLEDLQEREEKIGHEEM